MLIRDKFETLEQQIAKSVCQLSDIQEAQCQSQPLRVLQAKGDVRRPTGSCQFIRRRCWLCSAWIQPSNPLTTSRHEGGDAIYASSSSVSTAAIAFAAHLVMNPIIEVDADTARGKWRLIMPCTVKRQNVAEARWLLLLQAYDRKPTSTLTHKRIVLALQLLLTVDFTVFRRLGHRLVPIRPPRDRNSCSRWTASDVVSGPLTAALLPHDALV